MEKSEWNKKLLWAGCYVYHNLPKWANNLSVIMETQKLSKAYIRVEDPWEPEWSLISTVINNKILKIC